MKLLIKNIQLMFLFLGISGRAISLLCSTVPPESGMKAHPEVL